MRYNRVKKSVQRRPNIERHYGRFSKHPVYTFPFMFQFFRFDHLPIQVKSDVKYYYYYHDLLNLLDKKRLTSSHHGVSRKAAQVCDP